MTGWRPKAPDANPPNKPRMLAPRKPPPPASPSSGGTPTAEQELAAIRAEGLTGRQLRMARRIAQKHGLAPSSDFDAVRLLRHRGIDPFARGGKLELVVDTGTQTVRRARRHAVAIHRSGACAHEPADDTGRAATGRGAATPRRR